MSNNSAPSTSSTSQALSRLFRTVEDRFRDTDLGPERWYLLVLAAIAGAGEAHAAGPLYQYLVQQTGRESSKARQYLVRRLREVLIKSVAIYGVPRPIEGIVAIASVEAPEDRDTTFTRRDWASGEENTKQGRAWLETIYKGQLEQVLNLFKDHQDFAWVAQNITYGLFLSDRQTLDDVDTEIVVLAGIMVQNLNRESAWHIRGSRRVGMSEKDLQTVWECIKMVGEYAGINMSKVPRIEDVKIED